MQTTSYRLVEELGRGGFGAVYLGEHRSLGTAVVIKILHANLAAGMDDRFRLEAQLLSTLKHSHIVSVIDYGMTSDRCPYFVMDRLEGRTLGDELRERTWLGHDEAIELSRQTLAGLSAVHAAGVIHRDIKPDNLFLCDSAAGHGPVVKLLDFGLAKMVEDITGVAPLKNPTREGSLMGTPNFIAPEQIRGRAVDGRADLYAVGAMLYKMLTGRPPFGHHKNLPDLIKAHLTEIPRPPSEHAQQPLAAGLDEVIVRSLAKSPDERFQTADELAGELQKYHPSYLRLMRDLDLSNDAVGGGVELSETALLPATAIVDGDDPGRDEGSGNVNGDEVAVVAVVAPESPAATAPNDNAPNDDAPNDDGGWLDQAWRDRLGRTCFWLLWLLVAAAVVWTGSY